MRRYWQPVALSEELPPEAGRRLKVKILGEELVLFPRRSEDAPDCSGFIVLTAERISVTVASKTVGLRCLYHGWLYDVCRPLFSSSPESRAAARIEATIRHRCLYLQGGGRSYLCLHGPGRAALAARLTIFSRRPKSTERS